FVGPFVPDADLVFLQVGDVGLALQEPQQLVDDRAQVQLLGGDQGEALAQVEAHLPAEHAAGAGAGAVGLVGAMFQDMCQQLQVLLHALPPSAGITGCSTGAPCERHSRNRPSSTSGRLSSWPM